MRINRVSIIKILITNMMILINIKSLHITHPLEYPIHSLSDLLQT